MPTIKEAKAEFAREFESLMDKVRELCDTHGITFADNSNVSQLLGKVPDKIVVSDGYWDSSRC